MTQTHLTATLQSVAESIRVGPERILSRERGREVDEARNIAYYVMRDYYRHLFTDIAKSMHRTHGAVLYGSQTIRHQIVIYKHLAETVQGILAGLKS